MWLIGTGPHSTNPFHDKTNEQPLLNLLTISFQQSENFHLGAAFHFHDTKFVFQQANCTQLRNGTCSIWEHATFHILLAMQYVQAKLSSHMSRKQVCTPHPIFMAFRQLPQQCNYIVLSNYDFDRWGQMNRCFLYQCDPSSVSSVSRPKIMYMEMALVWSLLYWTDYWAPACIIRRDPKPALPTNPTELFTKARTLSVHLLNIH